MSSKDFAIHRTQRPIRMKDHKWEYETVEHVVRVMATAEGYAMVRLLHAVPFVVPEGELSPLEKSGESK